MRKSRSKSPRRNSVICEKVNAPGSHRYRRRPTATGLGCSLSLILHGLPVAAAPPWPEALLRLECRPAGGEAARISTAIAVTPDLLASVMEKSGEGDSYRAVDAAGTRPLKLLGRDRDSGFSLFAPVEKPDSPWPVVSLEQSAAVLTAGAELTLQSTAPVAARLAGRDTLHGGTLLQSPWLRVHLPPGTWMQGTPVTAPDGNLTGLLAGGVPDVPEAARILPVSAVRHFVKLWTERQTLARAELGIRLSHTDAIPRVIECYAALPAERAGIHPGDVLLRIGTTGIADAAGAAEACFYLRVDDPVKVAVLRGMDTIELTVVPGASAKKAESESK